jgi:MFS family permease
MRAMAEAFHATTTVKADSSPSLLSRERIIAPPSFNRWLVPPAALAIHLSIGMAYGLSVFWLPLSRAIGITKSAPDDWKISTLTWTFTLAIVFLGSSAAMFGKWAEREGPRKAGFVAGVCWAGGFLISAFGIYLHQIWLIYLGSGVIGGCGLGLGYISPVSTLIKWFPDRRGMATGLAIMGFGGGAMIGTPLADFLMKRFATPESVGVWQTFAILGAVYFVAMMAGAFGYRLPAQNWRPAGWTPPPDDHVAADAGSVPVEVAWKTPQFWFLWGVLCMNVTAGIAVLAIASPMIQEIFKGRVTASAAAGFTSLLSLFNIGGRIFWASLSDRIGRKPTYMIFFALGMLLYASAPTAGASGSLALFVAIFCVILTMYGGGFATIPAYLADAFGVGNVSAIHGRLLTAWSVAGVIGPQLVTYIRELQLGRGVAASEAYTLTMYILVALLGVGLICNLAVQRVDGGLFTLAPVHKSAARASTGMAPAGEWGLVACGWLLAGVPIAWGVTKTLTLVGQMFR